MLRDPSLPTAMRAATAAAATMAVVVLVLAWMQRAVPPFDSLRVTEGRVAAVELQRSASRSVEAVRIRLAKGGAFEVVRPQSRFSVVRSALQPGAVVRIRHEGRTVWQIDGVLAYEVMVQAARTNTRYGYQLAGVFALIAVLCGWYARIISGA